MRLKKILNLTIGLLTILNIYTWSNFYQITINSGALEIHFLDVGQGDAILIKTPENRYGLIDAGRGNEVVEELSKILPFYVKELEFILMTHNDADHIEGFIEILNRYKVKNVFLTKSQKQSGIFLEILDLLKEKEIQNYVINDLHDFKLGKIDFDIIWPTEEINTYSLDDTNSNSIGMILKFNNFELFTAGDLDKESELIATENLNLDTEIIKIGHHGSSTSTSEDLLKNLKPETAIISVGKNSYGHPTQEVIEILESQKLKILRTDQDGMITVKTNGINVLINTEY